MVVNYIKNYIYNLMKTNDDPIEASKNMVNSIQILVGIHNVFGDTNRKMTLLSLLATFVFAGTFVYVGTISQSIYLIKVIPDKLECFKAMNCLSSTCVPLSKYIFMWSSSDRLRKILDMSRQGLNIIPADTAAHNKMIRTLQQGRYVSFLVIINQATTHIFYLILPLLFTIFGNNRYLPTTPGEIFGLSSKYETPFYQISFVLTSIATCFSAINQTGYIVLFVNLLSHELGHFYAITESLNHIYSIVNDEEIFENDDMKQKTIEAELKLSIKHHQFIMIYHEKIKELYKSVFGAHFLMMTLVLVTTLQTMNSWNISNTILTGVTGVMPLFIYCFGGELLLSAETGMSTAAYSCGWELMNHKQARMVFLILALSQRPLYLTAADIFIMNRETFGDVVQIVYKIYAVFN
ncbi:odorant receptor 82a-like [Galleria mellonella]|uniref:Odorant receptor n=1 Tax=Galleria mellonella TaxID=7137 RepID=A0A6J1X871_GALME|nr:odorant receptor 82a-like [Galleria mellonella]